MFNEIYELEISGSLSGPDAPEFDTSLTTLIFFVEKNLITFSEMISATGIQNEKGLT